MSLSISDLIGAFDANLTKWTPGPITAEQASAVYDTAYTLPSGAASKQQFPSLANESKPSKYQFAEYKEASGWEVAFRALDDFSWQFARKPAAQAIGSVGLLLQATRQFAGGKRDIDLGGDIMELYTGEDRIDVGTSISFLVGQAAGLVGDTLTPSMVDNAFASTISQAQRKTASDMVRDWGLGTLSADFDIFSEKDRSYLAGEQGLNIGTVLTQGLNFAGDLLLDPINLIPVAKVGKLLYGGRQLFSKGGVLADRAVDLFDDYTKISQGVAPKNAGVLQRMEFLAQNKNTDSVMGLPEFSQSIDSNIGAMAQLTTRIDNVQDMADLFLAVEGKSLRAATNISQKYFAKEGLEGVETVFLLDEVLGGGIAARRAAAGVRDLGTIDSPQFSVVVDRLVTELEKTDEGIAFLDTTFGKISRDEAGQAVFSATPAPIVGLRPSNLKVVGAAEEALAKFRGYNSYAGKLDASTNIFVSGARPIVQWTQNARAVAVKNFIDVNNTDMQYMPKIKSILESADNSTKGALTRSGLREDYSRKAALATTPAQRGQIIKDMQKDLFTFMSENAGVPKEKAEVLFNELIEAQANMGKALRQKGTAMVPDGNGLVVVVDKAYLARQTDNFVDILPFDKMNQAIASAKPLINSMAFTTLVDGTRSVVGGVRATQQIWSSLVVTRPARMAREFLQNAVIFGLSGYGFEAWVARNANKEIGKNLTYNLKAVMARGKDYSLIVGGKSNNADNLLANARQARQTVKEMEETLRRFDEEQFAVWASTPIRDVEPDMLREMLETQAETTATSVYHSSSMGLPMELDVKRAMTAFTDQRSAKVFLNDSIPEVAPNFKAVRSALSKAVDAGDKIEVRSIGDTWRIMSPSEVDGFMGMGQKALQAYRIRVIPSGMSVSVRKLKVYGEEINLSHFSELPEDFKALLGLRSPADLKAYVEAGTWRTDARLLDYGRKNLVGRYGVAESGVPGGRTSILVPDFVAHGGKKGQDAALANVLRVRIERFVAASENPGALGDLLVAARNKKITKEQLEELLTTRLSDVRKADGEPVSLLDGLSNRKIAAAQKKIFEMRNASKTLLRPDYTKPSEGLSERVRQAREHLESAKITAAELDARAAERVAFESQQRAVPKARRGQGFVSVRGNLIPDFGQGADGRIFSSGLATGNTDLTRSEHAIAQSRHAVSVVEVKPNDPDYFDSVVDYINTNFRAPDSTTLDPVVRIVLEKRNTMNADDLIDEAAAWIKTPEGLQYARQLNLDPKEAEVWATTTVFNVNRHAPTDTIAAKLLNNEELTVDFFRTELQSKPELLVPLIGRIMDKRQTLGAMASAQEVMSMANKVLADMPTEAIFANPLAVAAYNRNIENRIALYQKVTGNTLVPANKMEEMVLQARRGARAEVRKYIYNSVGSSNFTESMRIVAPFITAQVFTLKAMTRATFNNPASAAWMLYMYNKAISSMPWVDENGVPTNDYDKAKGVLLPMDPWVRDNVLAKIPYIGDALKDSQSLMLSKISMDAVFQGNSVQVNGMNVPNPFMPGFGPFVALPLSEAMKSDPNNDFLRFVAEDLNVLPFGPQSDPLDEIIPGMTISTIKDMIFKDGSWQQAYNQNVMLATARFATGQIDAMPKAEEIRDATNKEMWLKSGIAFWSPVSTRVQGEYAVAKNRYNAYTEKYGFEDGAKRFKIENPDLLFATVSTSENKYNLRHTPVTIENLRSNPDLVASIASLPDDAAFVLGWAVNPEEPAIFDSTSYAWAANAKLPGLSADENYLRKLTAEEIQNKTLLAYALNDQARQFDAIDALAQERGTTVETDPELEKLQTEVRRQLRNSPVYGSAYAENLASSQGKYDNAVRGFEAVLTNAKWMSENGDKPVVGSLATFIAARNQIKNTLLEISYAGGKGTLGANPEIRDAYYAVINELKTKDLAFSQLYNRYFTQDRIV